MADVDLQALPMNDAASSKSITSEVDGHLEKAMSDKVVNEEEADVNDDEEVADNVLMNGHVDMVNMRIKKQKVGANVINNDQERPMSWEGELSDEDTLNNDGGSKTPSTLTEETSSKSPNNMAMEPGSPMSVNGSDKDEPILPTHKVVPELPPILKPASPFSVRSHSHSPVQPRHLGGPRHPITGHETSSQAPHYFTPQASPLQARHVNGHSYSSSSSPELAKHLFYSPTQSPVQSRHISSVGSSYSQSPSPRHTVTAEPSFSPSRSPVQSRHVTSQDSPYSSPYSSVGSPSGSSSIPFSPNQSPVQGRHPPLLSCPPEVPPPGFAAKHLSQNVAGPSGEQPPTAEVNAISMCDSHDDKGLFGGDLSQHASLAGQAGISRQQLINSPCPICGDKISGFHYGIFSCESCKGFFKRTVQNKKNYLCLRGATCPITVTTRKKCPACRFDKCLKMGMKLEAIREDRTRGGRSTYQCSYTLPSTMLQSPYDSKLMEAGPSYADGIINDIAEDLSSRLHHGAAVAAKNSAPAVPQLIQEIMSVEHLWHYTEGDAEKMGDANIKVSDRDPDFFSNLCNIADHRLYKIVKWCKSLPLFRNIQIDDQICLLLNSWCELLLLSCCFRSIPTPGEIRVSLGKSLTLGQARMIGLGPVIERMLNLTEHLRRLRVDQYEYVCLKVIILLTSDVTDLKEPEAVRQSQEKVIQALQSYSLSHYMQHPSKFGELLLRIPELKRTCHIGKESLSIKHREGEIQSFNLLVELLRGEH